MKKLIVAMILLVGFTTTAQKGKDKSHKEKMTLEQRANLQTKKMVLSLDLTQSQQKQVLALNLKNAKMHKTKMEERKAKKENDETKRPSSDERYVMQIEKLDHQIAQKAAMKKILSKEQMEKWEKMAVHKKRRSLKNKKNHHQKGKPDGKKPMRE